VLLNGEVEYQKRKKVYHNDIVEFNGEVLQIIINESLNENLTDHTVDNSGEENVPQGKNIEKSSTLNASNQQKNKSTKKAVPANEGTAKNSKRKPISF